MVKDVEELSPEINVHVFRYRDRLQDGKISLAEVRPAADRTFRGSERPQQRRVIAPENCARRAGGSGVISGILRETIGIEVIVSVRLRLHGTERCDLRRLAWQFEIEAIHQLVIGQRRDLDGKSRLKRSDARDRPSIQQLASRARKLPERQFPVIAKDQSVTSVKGRQRATDTRINWIENSLKARRLIKRLAEGVRGGELQAMGKPLIERRLQRVIGRVGNRVLSKDTAEDWNKVRWAASCGWA